jgi:hypothetical protein
MSGLQEIEDTLSQVAQHIEHAKNTSITEVDALIQCLEAAKVRIMSEGPSAIEDTLSSLQGNVSTAEHSVQAGYKTLAGSVGVFSKVIDTAMYSCVNADVDEGHSVDEEALLRLIAEQLLHDGYIDLADDVAKQSSIVLDAAMRTQYVELQTITRNIVDKNDVTQALVWCRDILTQTNIKQGADTLLATIRLERIANDVRTLEFKLHALQCTRLLTKEGSRNEAIAYLRRHLTPLANTKGLWRDVQRLMTSMVYAPTPLDGAFPVTAPYTWLHDNKKAWRDAAQLFIQCWCRTYQLPRLPPLQVCVDAGFLVMPVLRKYMNLPMRTADTALQLDPLPPEYSFQSWACCPVTQQLATSGEGANPAMLLPCAHIISQNAMRSLVRAGSHRLKCPYCPTECEAANSLKLFA